MQTIRCNLAVAMWLLALAAQASVQAESPQATPLGVRQDSVKQMVEEMKQKFVQLYQALRLAEPDQAARLELALEQIGDAQIVERMQQITAQLDAERLDAAAQEQAELVVQLRQIIRLLTDEDELDKLLREIRELEKWKRQINRIIREETDLRNQSDRLTDKDKTLAGLDQKLAVLKDLIRQQDRVTQSTAQAAAQGAHKLSRIADEQRRVRQATEALTKSLQPPGPDGQSPDPSAPQEDQGQQGRANQSLQKASQEQRSAESDMAEGKGNAAQSHAGNALKKLKQALKELEAERQRIAELPPEHFEELAKQQDQTGDETAKLAQEMAKGGQQGEQGEQGQQDVASARQSMEKASGQLRGRSPDGAKQNQQQAINQLQQAREKIEEKLAQLREEMQQEMLAALEQRFAEMLRRQREVTLATADMHHVRTEASDTPKPLTRAQRLLCAGLAEEEQVLASLAEKALQIIIEDGTTVIFPTIVEQLQQDLQTASGFLAREKTGPYTRQLQRQIEQMLEDLIEALKQAQQQQQQQTQQQPQQQQEQPPLPLVPESAELKLLRAAQIRVNRRTAGFDRSRPQGELDDLMIQEVQRIRDRQEQVRTMAEDMYDLE